MLSKLIPSCDLKHPMHQINVQKMGGKAGSRYFSTDINAMTKKLKPYAIYVGNSQP
jgi:hypothetical protein